MDEILHEAVISDQEITDQMIDEAIQRFVDQGNVIQDKISLREAIRSEIDKFRLYEASQQTLQ